MIPKTENQFQTELEEAMQALESRGREVSVGNNASEDAGISCDFELPYSSLPTIQTSRWN